MDGNTRKKDVLKLVVETFVHTNQPVGSLQVAEQLPYEVSSATVRNDMAEMTELGVLQQPHTSAGRVPTDVGYRHYVKMLTEERRELSRYQRGIVEHRFRDLKDFQSRYQTAVELLAELSGSIGFLMDDSRNVYISGLSNVAKLPEFTEESFGVKLVEVLEQPEEFIQNLTNLVASNDINVLIGDNPQIRNATIVISNFGPKGKRIISIIGPVRMHYNKALPLVDYMKKLLDEF